MQRARSVALSDFATFGDFLKYLRRRAQLTQTELAIACGYDTSHMSRLESNQRLPDQATLLALFVPALGLQDEPELVERLLALAAESRQADSAGDEKSQGAPPPRNNLPSPSTPFVGRSDELARIAELLDDPTCRLLTLTGPGGIGKTRLALQAAAERLPNFANGVFFVSMVGVSSPDFIISKMADALGFTFHSGSGPQLSDTEYQTEDTKTQLLNYLRAKAMLLVMDNFEHLLDGVNLLPELLNYAPAVKIMATSREPLALQEEWVFTVGGLEVPDEMPLPQTPLPQGEGLRLLESYSAVQLFAQRARRVKVGFSLPDHADSVIRICQRMDGMPLGIELAAGLLGAIPITEIADQIEHNLDLLETSLRNMPERHRSLRAMFEQSWSLLSEIERATLMKLSVFRGGFRREAAEYVTEVPFRVLLALVSKSLVRLNPSGRYGIHELLRQFAEEKLRALPSEWEAAQDRHCEYFADFVHQREVLLYRQADKTALEETQADIENVRTAWDRAVFRTKSTEISSFVHGLTQLLFLQGGIEEGLETFKKASDILSNRTLDDAGKLALGRILARRAVCEGELQRSSWQDIETLLERSLSIFQMQNAQWDIAYVLRRIAICETNLRQLEKASAFFQKSIDICHDIGETTGMCESLLGLGKVIWEQGKAEEATSIYRNVLALAKESGSPRYMAFALDNLGEVSWRMGQYREARGYCQESLTLCRTMGGRRQQGMVLKNLAFVAFLQGEVEEAKQLAQEGLEILQEIGDRQGAAFALREMGLAESGIGHHEAAIQIFQECLVIFRELNFRNHIGGQLNMLSCEYWFLGDFAQAKRLAQESLTIVRETGPRSDWADVLDTLGQATESLGQHQEAKGYFLEALKIDLEVKHLTSAVISVGGMAKVLAAQGQPERALELLGVAQSHPAASRSDFLTTMGPLLDEFKAELPPEVLAAGLERGKSLDLETVIAELLREGENP